MDVLGNLEVDGLNLIVILPTINTWFPDLLYTILICSESFVVALCLWKIVEY